MTRMSLFNSPLLLGFDHVERMLEQAAKSAGDSYPPYNIEQTGEESLRITLAVAGFRESDLTVTVRDNQLLVAGRQEEMPGRRFIHRGIAARQFQRSFVLAEGIEIEGAELADGLLHIDLRRPLQESIVREIKIASTKKKPTQTT